MTHQGRERSSIPSPCSSVVNVMRGSSVANVEPVGRGRWADLSDDEAITAPPSPPPPLVPQDECWPGDCPPSPCSTAAISVDFADRKRWADFSSDEELDVFEQRCSPGWDGDGDFARSPCFTALLPAGTFDANDAEGAEETSSSQVEPGSIPVRPSRSDVVCTNRKQCAQHAGNSLADRQTCTRKSNPKMDIQSSGAQMLDAENAHLINSTRPLKITSQANNPASVDGEGWSVARGNQKQAKANLKQHWIQQQKQGDHSFWSASSKTWWTSGIASRNTGASSAHRPAGSRSKHITRHQERSRGATQCQFFIGIAEDAEFSVVRKVLGPHGANVKRIAEKTGAKLRLRGLGSGFLEGPEKKESADPLMLCVSAPDVEAYELTKVKVIEVLEKVYELHREHCRRIGKEALDVHVNFHEGYRPGAR